MASINRRRNRDGSVTYTALVRIRPYKPFAKTFPSRPAAVAWAEAQQRELREQRATGGLRADTTALTVAEIIEEYRREPAQIRLKAAASGSKLLDWWVKHYGSVKARELSVLRLREARDLLASTGERKVSNGEGGKVTLLRAPATVHKHMAKMRACWNWARGAGLVPVSQQWPPGLGIPLPRPEAKFLTDAELVRIVRAAEAAGPLMNAAVTVALMTGIRQGEQLSMNWSSVDLDRATLTLTDTKNGESRAVYLPPPAVEALRTLREQPVTSLTHVFVVSEQVPPELEGDKPTMRIVPLDTYRLISRWRKVQKAAQVTCNWHRLRHCAASYLLAAGATLAEVGSALGHKSTASTSRYAHLVAGRALPAHEALAKRLRDARAGTLGNVNGVTA